MFLFLDCETTNLLRADLGADAPQQPYLVQAAAELCNDDAEPVDWFKRRVRLPSDAVVADGAEQVHGISTRSAKRVGAAQRWVLFGLIEMLNEARYGVSYGTFDRQVGESVIRRLGGAEMHDWLTMWNRPGLEWINAIEPAAALCQLPSTHFSGGHKWPSLDVACETLLGEPPRVGKHDSWIDCQRLRRLFFELRSRGAIEL